MPRGVPRIPEPFEWILTKRCTACEKTKPWAQFSPLRSWPDGSVKGVRSRCKACESKRAAVRYGDYRRRNPDKVRAYQREWKRRRNAELRADATSEPRIPLEPFKTWLLAKYGEYGNWEMLADMFGVPDRTLRRVISENDSVRLSLVDRCLTAAGDHLNDLYPHDLAEVRS